MNKLVSLKLQLAEAAKYIRTGSPSHQRLAVILLDNFIELQLTSQFKEKLMYDSLLPISIRKYSTKKQRNISKYHEKLLEACVNEQIITYEQSVLLSFCHDVRNKNYHHGKDDSLLTKVSVKLLYDLIFEYQPKWQAGFYIILNSDQQEEDPFPIAGENGTFLSYANRWNFFLQEYFLCRDLETIRISTLLSNFLKAKLYAIQDAIKFLEVEEFPKFFPQSNWDLNRLLFHYAFKRYHKQNIETAQENSDKLATQSKIQELVESYRKTWSFKKVGRIDTLLKKAESICLLETYESVREFLKYKEEILTIYHATTDAAADLSEIIDSQSDY